ncbi:hypothetical protein RN001_000219 [Aquatica leii]|uniref:FXNA-like protease n=1 Tax=Aquatica leii TaxID=1421715 RepID=A0AAN7SQH3_9COLE|nr:hypothetical protein RN001_000219 [Aquatica leii]
MRNRHEDQTLNSDLLDGYNSKSRKGKVSIHSVSLFAAITFILSLLILFVTLKTFNGLLPRPLEVIHERNNPDAFISERAIHDLKLLSSLGPRVTGSYENEALAVNFFKREIAFINQRTHRNQKLEVDLQTVSGSYFLNLKSNPEIHAYSKVQNIVVRLHGKSSSHSLLLNSHFDTVPRSPGGSDDGINCVIMLEILRKLSRSPERLQHNVIFLFNGAEELGLKAAHGFITKHKWANQVRAVINLDAGGAGGKEHLFQISNKQPWIFNYYKQLPHPNAHVVGEELFQSGIIPSDTDYRIFRDFGDVSGLDFAFVSNGYRYHTKYDDFYNIPNGTYQHAGENLLKLTKLMGNALDLPTTDSESEKFVYYDFFGYFIHYKGSVAVVLNVIVSVVSIALAVRSCMDFGVGTRYILCTFASILLGWFSSAAFVALTATIIDLLKSTMSWYGNQWFVFGLYVVPTLTCCCGSILLWNYYNETLNLSLAAQTQLQLHTVRCIWTLLLLLGTYFEIRSVSLLLVPIIFQNAVFIVVQALGLQYSVKKWQLIYIFGTITSCLYLMNVWQLLSTVLIPVCGRIGSDKNPEFIIGMYTCLSTILTLSCYVPFITLVNNSSAVIKLFLGVFLTSFLVITITPLGFPYSDNLDSPTPQRFWIFHTSRTFRNNSNHIVKKNSGFFILNWDRNGPYSLMNNVKSSSRIKSIADDCDDALFCGLPLANGRVLGIKHENTWIPAAQPIIHEPTDLKLILKSKIADTIVRFNFSVTGPSHMHIALSAKPNTTLMSTSLVDRLPENPIIWNNKPTYVIMHMWGVESTPLLFTLDFKVPKYWEGPIMDIAVVGHCVHDRTNVKTPQFVQFLNEFPKWADVTPYLTTYDSWVY